MRLFAPEGSAEGCASGECLPEAAAVASPQSPAPAAQATAPATPAPRVPAPSGAAPAHGGWVAQATAKPAPSAPAPREAEDLDEEPPAPITSRGPASEAEQWRRAVDALREASPRHGKSLSHGRFLGFVPEGVRVAFPPDAAFHRAQVMGMSRALVEAELTKALRRPVKLVEDTTTQALQAAPKSIAEVEATDRAGRERAIDARVRAHPAVRSVIKHLGGAVEHVAYLEPVARPAVADGPDEGDAGPPVD